LRLILVNHDAAFYVGIREIENDFIFTKHLSPLGEGMIIELVLEILPYD